MGHIWGQPYPGREEGNSRESLPFLGPGKGITLGLSLPFPAPSSREGKGREGNPYPIPQRNYIFNIIIIVISVFFTDFYFFLYRPFYINIYIIIFARAVKLFYI